MCLGWYVLGWVGAAELSKHLSTVLAIEVKKSNWSTGPDGGRWSSDQLTAWRPREGHGLFDVHIQPPPDQTLCTYWGIWSAPDKEGTRRNIDWNIGHRHARQHMCMHSRVERRIRTGVISCTNSTSSNLIARCSTLFYNSIWCPLCIQLLLSRLALCLAALLAWHILCQGWARVSLVRSHLGVNTVLDGLRGELLLLLNCFLIYIRPENDDDGRKDAAREGATYAVGARGGLVDCFLDLIHGDE